MAYKNIHEKFWTDIGLRRLSIKDKYLFFYLITNPYSHFSGIYYLSITSMIEETGLTKNEIMASLKRLAGKEDKDRVYGGYQDGSQKVAVEYQDGSQKVAVEYQDGSQKVAVEYQDGSQKVFKEYQESWRDCFLLYDEDFRVVWVKNCLRYQLAGRFSMQQIRGVENHLATLQPSPLIKLFIDYYKNLFGLTFFYQERYPISRFSLKSPVSVSESESEDSKQYTEVKKRFEEWWDIYPDRNGKKLEKQESLKRFLKIPENEIPSLMSATQNYAESDMVGKGIGIKDPKRFLNEYWREWIAPEQKKEKVNPFEQI